MAGGHLRYVLAGLNSLVQPIWFGQYRLTARIATGGMAEVYVGRHVEDDGTMGAMVAVKRLLPHHVKNPSIVRMFLNEARITSQIGHPNVVRIIELGQVGGEPFIAMELLEGKSFEEVRAHFAEQGKRVPTRLALHVLAEACRGLDAAHRAVDEQGQPLALVHRDFTPDNVHVGFDGQVKVIDFGIARTATWGSGTEPGILKGKFFYMSPEMVLAQPVDHRADLFAAGVMLYEQLCGRRPFTGMSVDEVLHKIAACVVRPLSELEPAVSPALERVALTALQRDPEARYPSLAHFVQALEAAAQNEQPLEEGELGRWLETHFPAGADERRQALQHARNIDPSMPGMVNPPVHTSLADDEAFGPTLQSLPAIRDSQPLPLVTSAPPPAVVPPRPSAPAPLAIPPLEPKKPKPWGLVAAVVLAVGLVGGGAAYLLRSRPAEELLAEARAAREPSAKARPLLTLARSASPTEAMLAEGGALLLESGPWAEALDYAAAWQKHAPTSDEAWLLEARAATRLRQGKRAEAAIREAAKRAPGDARCDLALAELREAQGDGAGAAEAVTRALEHRPGDAALLKRLGALHAQAGKLDEAAQALEAALKKGPDAEALVELGAVELRKEKALQARKHLEAAVKLKPELMLGHYYLATALYAGGDLAGARAQYLAADGLAGDDSRPLEGLCQLEAQQQPPQMADVTQRITARFPKQARELLGRCVP